VNKDFLFDWEGGLSELKDRYTSVELQHKTSGITSIIEGKI